MVKILDGSFGDRERKRLFPNAAFAVAQVIATSLTLFFLYRYLIAELGVASLGIWSLVGAATSLAGISSLGLAGGAVRTVSQYLAHDNILDAGKAAETATVSIAVAIFIGILVIWPFSDWILGLAIPAGSLRQGLELIPFTFAALWLGSIGTSIYSALDGCHRADQRSILTISTQPILLLLTVLLVPKIGLVGLAYAQIAQYVVWLTVGWLCLRKQLPSLSIFPVRWDRSLFKIMFRYGVHFQMLSLLTLFSEPLVKGLVSHFMSLTDLGYFETANRLVVQIRGLLASANQVAVPYYSKISESSNGQLNKLYRKNIRVLILVGSLCFFSLIALLPTISYFLIGRVETTFLVFSIALAGGWFVNIIGLPAYFANLGGGWVVRNVYVHLAQTASVLLVGCLGSILFGGIWSALSWPIALVLGTIVGLGYFQKVQNISLDALLNRDNAWPIFLGLTNAIMAWGAYVLIKSTSVKAALVSATAVWLVGTVIFAVLIFRNRSSLRFV